MGCPDDEAIFLTVLACATPGVVVLRKVALVLGEQFVERGGKGFVLSATHLIAPGHPLAFLCEIEPLCVSVLDNLAGV